MCVILHRCCILASVGLAVLCVVFAATRATADPSVARFGSVTDFTHWVAKLRTSSKADGGRTAVIQALGEVDSRHDASIDEKAQAWNGTNWEPAPVAGIDLFWGHMDADDDKEAVVQVRFHDEGFIGAGERVEAFWIGVFDVVPGGLKLVGTIHRALVHCSFDDAPLGLLLDFTHKTSNPKAVLQIRTQEVDSCGTLLDFWFKMNEVQVTSKGLDIREAAAPDGMHHDRLEGMRPKGP
jgi:hypothetical protein